VGTLTNKNNGAKKNISSSHGTKAKKSKDTKIYKLHPKISSDQIFEHFEHFKTLQPTLAKHDNVSNKNNFFKNHCRYRALDKVD